MRESERLRARLREITTLAATMTFRAEGTVAQEAPVLAADAIAALERAEAERERLRVILDPFMTDTMMVGLSPLGTRCICVPPLMWRTTIAALYEVFYPPKEATDGA